jgi:glyoxylase-like metal-dependent hydrolase (beta-lactamase superfamily II)
MIKISEKLYAATGKGLFWVPVFIITKDNESLTLIDTGLQKDVKKVIKQLREKWGSLEKIKRIIFTHRHADHTGGLGTIIDEIKKINPNHKVEIVCHKDEAPHFGDVVTREDLQPNRLVEHEEMIDENLGIKGIHVPGHTYGHLCLLLEKENIMLLGDVIIWMFGGLKQVMEKAHDDWNLSQQSMNIILNYRWETGIPSHFKLKEIPRQEIENYISALMKK